MDTITIVLLITTILLVIACIVLAVTQWKSWSDSEKSLSYPRCWRKHVLKLRKTEMWRKSELKVNKTRSPLYVSLFQ